MVQIQFDLSEDLNKKIKIFMAFNDIDSKADAIEAIVDEYFLIRPNKYKTIDEKREEEIYKKKKYGSK